LKYFGVALDNKDWGMKTLRGNECGTINIAVS